MDGDDDDCFSTGIKREGRMVITYDNNKEERVLKENRILEWSLRYYQHRQNAGKYSYQSL